MALDQFVYGYIAGEESYEDKALIIEEGNKGDWIYVIMEGQVKVKKRTPRGMVTLQILRQGEFFGEMALLEHGKWIRTASVIADGPVRLGVLDNERLIKDYESISPRLRALFRAMTMKLRETTKKAVTLVAESI
ncbi:MAG: cyclic nucleotide-binding domain-containing protein [Deltaproteobacteria bacterium]|nr:cyclic nucleotide-binding domain-containing protein [Deltaproteobacteria bacterium]